MSKAIRSTYLPDAIGQDHSKDSNDKILAPRASAILTGEGGFAAQTSGFTGPSLEVVNG